MRIKRLLKFIDITDSIKLCHHLGGWLAGWLEWLDGSLCCWSCVALLLLQPD